MEKIRELWKKILGQPLEIIVAEIWLTVIVLIVAIINIKGLLIVSSIFFVCAYLIRWAADWLYENVK